MRIVVLVGLSTGGIGTHAVDLARELGDLGDEVVFVTDPVTADRFNLADARLWWPGRSAGVAGSLGSLVRLHRLVRGADVVHAHGHQAGLLATIVSLGVRTPLVVSQHNAVLVGGPKRRLLDLVQRLVARRAALVTGASTDLVDSALAHGARDARLAPVPSPRVPTLLATEPLAEAERRQLARKLLRDNGIDVEPGTSLVLTIARIAQQKDLQTLVEAAASVTHANVELAPPTPALTQHLHESASGGGVVWVVVGGGDQPLHDLLEERAAVLGSPVHFVGPQDGPDRWLQAADVFVLTSRWEARALVVQEAMAAGVPVVATDTGGLPDLVDGVGTLVPVHDPAAVARAVERYLTDPAARHTASVAGRDRATSWDDGNATARRWREWYSGLLEMT